MIKISCDTKFARPGENIQWTAVWEFEQTKEYHFEANLSWYTHGKGDSDGETAIEHEWSSTQNNGKQVFNWIAPRSPASFYGTLIKLNWQIEFTCYESDEDVTHAIQISHSPEPIRLPAGKSLKEVIGDAFGKRKDTVVEQDTSNQ